LRSEFAKGPLEFREHRVDLPKAQGNDQSAHRTIRQIGMAQSPQPYDLVTRPCTIHAGRFRWDIREHGRPIQSSIESFATEQEAHADGRHELEKIIQVSRL
jgi:hypothetical protein